MQQGTLTGAYANAVQDAAKNEAGAMTGFLGVGTVSYTHLDVYKRQIQYIDIFNTKAILYFLLQFSIYI